jgi:hypothetical protein
VKTVKEMFTELWKDRDVITVDHCVNITLPVRLRFTLQVGFVMSNEQQYRSLYSLSVLQVCLRIHISRFTQAQHLFKGFGRSVSWKEDVVVPEGYTMSFKDALHTVALDTFVKAIVPEPLLGITKKTRNCRDAFTDLRVCHSLSIKTLH